MDWDKELNRSFDKLREFENNVSLKVSEIIEPCFKEFKIKCDKNGIICSYSLNSKENKGVANSFFLMTSDEITTGDEFVASFAVDFVNKNALEHPQYCFSIQSMLLEGNENFLQYHDKADIVKFNLQPFYAESGIVYYFKDKELCDLTDLMVKDAFTAFLKAYINRKMGHK